MSSDLVLGRAGASGVTWQVLDDGVRPDGRHRVGADAKLVGAAKGDWWVAYQDSRRGDWWLARATPAGKVTRQLLADAGSAGWSSSAVVWGGAGWLWSSTTRNLTPAGSLVQSQQWFVVPP